MQKLKVARPGLALAACFLISSPRVAPGPALANHPPHLHHDPTQAPGQIQHDPNMQVDVQLGVQPNALCIFVVGHLKVRQHPPTLIPVLALGHNAKGAVCAPPLSLCHSLAGAAPLIRFRQLNGENPLHFSQFFQLVATGPGQYTLNNDIFRLIYA